MPSYGTIATGLAAPNSITTEDSHPAFTFVPNNGDTNIMVVKVNGSDNKVLGGVIVPLD